jgi:hypothetical protein
MNHLFSIDNIPLYGVFLLSIAYILLAIFAGMRIYALGEKTGVDRSKEQTGSVVGATLALLAFVLAFTFNMAASRYDTKKQLLLSEINAIDDTYLKSGLLMQPYKDQSRQLLRNYVDLRLEAAEHSEMLNEIIQGSEEIHKELWSAIETIQAKQQYTRVVGLYIGSLSNLIQLHYKRVVVVLHTRIPDTIWLGLYIIAALAMITVGYQFGQARRFPGAVSIVLAMAFSSVLTLIVDLDRAVGGTIVVDQIPYIQLQERLQE